MTEFPLEDDRKKFIKFMNGRKVNRLDIDLLDDARSVVLNRKFSHATRLAAAKLLVCKKNDDNNKKFLSQPFLDWVLLTAMLEESDTDRAVQFIKAWMMSFEKRRVCDSEDEIMFLSSLGKVLAKKGNDFKKRLTVSELKVLHRCLLVTFVILSELEHGSKLFERAVKFVARTALVDENIFEFCFHELAPDLRGRFHILGIFLQEPCSSVCSKIEPVIKTICAQLSYELNSQLLLTAAADFLAALVVRFPASTDLLELFIRNTTHHVKRIRFNVLRWFGRLQVTKESVEFLSSLQRAISQLFQSTDDDLWPPCVWETEDVSCVKPRWDYEEGEDVLWQDDRVLNAYLDVSNVLNQRFGIKPDRDDPMIIVGMKWHLPEIRLAAFHLWATCLEKALEDSENNSVLEQFIIHNSSRSISILPRPVNVASESCLMPSEGKIEWVKEVNNFRCKLEDDQRGMSYLPEDVRGTSLPLPSPELARRRLEECMQISGSCDSKSCPEFDVLYINLEKAGYDQRVFARYVIDVINLIKSHDDVETALNAISDTVARCRLKVVVNHGCSVVDELLSVHRHDDNFFCLADRLYCWAMNHLIDKEAEFRTLAMSRILWSVCERSQNLLEICFETFRTTLSSGSLDGRVHHRVLKTLKLFTSKADCKLPADFFEFLFWHCIEVQTQSDFLVRSAATILFGFLVGCVTKSRVVPAFYIVSKRAKFWIGIMKRCSSLVMLPSLQRILLLSFLSRLTLGHLECYSASVLQTIYSLLVSLIELLEVTPDIRERRFCLEILVAMSPVAAHEEVLTLLNELHLDHISRVDYDFLKSTMKVCYEDNYVTENRMVPHDLLQSPFVKIIAKCETCDPKDGLEEINHMFSCVEPYSAELSLQAIAVAMTRIATNMRQMQHMDHLRESFVTQCIDILQHPHCSSRAVSMISRVPVCLGLTKNYLQECYVVQILKRWASSSAT